MQSRCPRVLQVRVACAQAELHAPLDMRHIILQDLARGGCNWGSKASTREFFPHKPRVAAQMSDDSALVLVVIPCSRAQQGVPSRRCAQV